MNWFLHIQIIVGMKIDIYLSRIFFLFLVLEWPNRVRNELELTHRASIQKGKFVWLFYFYCEFDREILAYVRIINVISIRNISQNYCLWHVTMTSPDETILIPKSGFVIITSPLKINDVKAKTQHLHEVESDDLLWK